DQLRAALKRAPTFDAAGHRVVHGDTRFREAVVIDESVREALAGLSDLDPEHMQASLAGIDAVSAAFPTLPQVAAFDTAFHATLPEAAAGYGLPFEWTERWGPSSLRLPRAQRGVRGRANDRPSRRPLPRASSSVILAAAQALIGAWRGLFYV
ncbi:MAG: hypothetical protein WA970_11305, partial [Gammaproteobacteria bacterium]